MRYVPTALPPQSADALVLRNYVGLLGADFSSDASNVGVRRAAECRNMYRTYSSSLGECIQTRPGFRRVSHGLGGQIYGIHFAEIAGSLKALVHSGTKLFAWSNYPEAMTASTATLLFPTMALHSSVCFVSGGKLYLLDGANYLCYDGSTVSDVCSSATVPITVTGRAPAGGGNSYQQVNLLTPKRINSFCADGTSTVYQLDGFPIDSAAVTVTHNGAAVTGGFTVNTAAGTVTFATPPAAPATPGTDNLTVEFSKTTAGYCDRIKNCTSVVWYDGRAFFSANPAAPFNYFSMPEDPTYIGDLNYNLIGTTDRPITGIMTIFNQLLTLKSNKVFFQSGADSTEELLPRVYPVSGGAECAGCIAPQGYANFLDDPVFVSRLGLAGLDKLSNTDTERYVGHRSSLVDGKLINEPNLSAAVVAEWNGYLLLLVNGHIYLADSRNTSNGEYEWFYWDGIGLYEGDTFKKATALAVREENVFFGTQNGFVCKLNSDRTNAAGDMQANAYADDSDGAQPRAIESRWSFCFDDFGKPNEYKTLQKKGSVIHARAIAHSAIKVYYRTDGVHEELITRLNSGFFDFGDIDFSDFTFNTFAENDIVFRKKIKRFKRLQITLASDELYKPFGIYGLTVTAKIGGYYKA